MKLLFSFCAICVLFSCSEPINRPSRGLSYDNLADTTIPVLWRVMKADTFVLDSANSRIDTISTIVVNEAYCQNAPDAIKAAIGYIGTFIGSECQWDGEAKDDRSNLKCKLISALGLGYQCSKTQLDLLRHWLRNERDLLQQIENCPTTPFTASSQNTFDSLNIHIKKDTVSVVFGANGINMPMEKCWTWTGEYIFQIKKDELRLISKRESEPEYSNFFDD